MEKFFRKEYLPAILIYIASALFFVTALIMFFTNNHHWATILFIGIAVMLFASSRLVNIGRELREDDISSDNKDI